MRRFGPVQTAGTVLVALALAGFTGMAPAAAAPAKSPTAAGMAAKPGKATKSGKAARKAKALKRCRAIKSKPKRRACVKRVHRKFAPQKPARPDEPAFTGATHYVEVGDDYYSPTQITIDSGDAVVWQWLTHNKDDHNVSMYEGPGGVDPFDFELADAPAVGPDWRRVFKVKGIYLMGCSLHHLQRITIVVK